MDIINTGEWLLDEPHPAELAVKLQDYFPGWSAYEIEAHLARNGMFRKEKNWPFLYKKEVWEVIKKEADMLKKEWQGPSIPIFIFPSDDQNEELLKLYAGKSGLAFADKLFLFVHEQTGTKELRALFTHEYNHVCRFKKLKKPDAAFTLLDTVIAEGIAENAVLERFGKDYTAGWTKTYTTNELEHIWQKIILPNVHLLKSSIKHQLILFGKKGYPRMSGYCTGFYLVHNYLKKNGLAIKDILGTPAKAIASIPEKDRPFRSFFT